MSEEGYRTQLRLRGGSTLGKLEVFKSEVLLGNFLTSGLHYSTTDESGFTHQGVSVEVSRVRWVVTLYFTV